MILKVLFYISKANKFSGDLLCSFMLQLPYLLFVQLIICITNQSIPSQGCSYYYYVFNLSIPLQLLPPIKSIYYLQGLNSVFNHYLIRGA